MLGATAPRLNRFFEEFSRGDIDAAFAMVSDDVRWWVPGDLPFSGTKSKAEYLQVVGAIQQGFPQRLHLDPLRTSQHPFAIATPQGRTRI